MSLERMVRQDAKGCQSVLDLGTMDGRWLAKLSHIPRRMGVDIWDYRDKFLGRLEDFTHEDAGKYLMSQHQMSWDLVLMLDFIEHLERAKALRIISHAKRVTRDKLIVFCPEGEHPQTPEDSARKCGWDIINPHQEHVSTWQKQDLTDLGFTVTTAPMKWPNLYAVWTPTAPQNWRPTRVPWQRLEKEGPGSPPST